MDNPESALIVAAHPDDIDFGAAGTVATWVDAGARVSYLVVTDGDAGGSDRTMERSEMAAIRRKEQRDAARQVGVEVVEFLGFPDGRLIADLELRLAISRVIRRHRPTRVVCPSPERDFQRLFASHPDHLAVGEATLCAIYPDARNPFAFPELLEEGLEPHSVGEIWLMASPRSERRVDITSVIDRKLAALASHKSQLVDPTAMLDRVRGWNADVARTDFGEGHFAEEFALVSLPV